MTRDYRDYLDDIVMSIDEVCTFTSGMSFEQFANDRKTRNAVVRSLEVLGEAAKRIPEEIRLLAPEVAPRNQTACRT
ncbi:MAG: DUF86 domain-containing protein [Candidatus Hydrogenedentota bacterium]